MAKKKGPNVIFVTPPDADRYRSLYANFRHCLWKELGEDHREQVPEEILRATITRAGRLSDKLSTLFWESNGTLSPNRRDKLGWIFEPIHTWEPKRKIKLMIYDADAMRDRLQEHGADFRELFLDLFHEYLLNLEIPVQRVPVPASLEDEELSDKVTMARMIPELNYQLPLFQDVVRVQPLFFWTLPVMTAGGASVSSLTELIEEHGAVYFKPRRSAAKRGVRKFVDPEAAMRHVDALVEKGDSPTRYFFQAGMNGYILRAGSIGPFICERMLCSADSGDVYAKKKGAVHPVNVADWFADNIFRGAEVISQVQLQAAVLANHQVRRGSFINAYEWAYSEDRGLFLIDVSIDPTPNVMTKPYVGGSGHHAYSFQERSIRYYGLRLARQVIHALKKGMSQREAQGNISIS